MLIITLAVIVYGIIAGVSHETLFMGIAIMTAGLSAGFGGKK